MKLRKTSIAYSIAAATLLLSLEGFSRLQLFKFVSYHNYDAIDWQMGDFKNQSKIDTVFIGSSEVRYGLNPEVFDSAFPGFSFNLGIDGMNLSYYRLLLPHLKLEQRAHSIKYAIIGLNVVEDVTMFPTEEEGGFDCSERAGVLQKGLFTSAFGIDTGLARVCKMRLTAFGRLVDWGESKFFSLRYRRQLRSYLLNPLQKKRSRQELDQTPRGHHMRTPLGSAQAMDVEIKKWWAEAGKKSSPLSVQSFQASISEGGLYAWYIDFFQRRNITPVFVSLPTNPKMIEMLGHTAAYSERSQALSQWFSSRGVLYIDLGLKTDYELARDFADRRHLSLFGAEKFTAELGQVLNTNILKK